MSVLIKGMNMPNDCRECALGQHTKSGIRCIVLSKRDGFSHSTGFGTTVRMSDCPLVEVPIPHGRLIDADKLFLDIEWSDIENAPTVIEAEE